MREGKREKKKKTEEKSHAVVEFCCFVSRRIREELEKEGKRPLTWGFLIFFSTLLLLHKKHFSLFLCFQKPQTFSSFRSPAQPWLSLSRYDILSLSSVHVIS